MAWQHQTVSQNADLRSRKRTIAWVNKPVSIADKDFRRPNQIVFKWAVNKIVGDN